MGGSCSHTADVWANLATKEEVQSAVRSIEAWQKAQEQSKVTGGGVHRKMSTGPLLQRVGGLDVVKQVVESFYRKLYSNERLLIFLHDKDMVYLRAKQTAFMSWLFGPPNQPYLGRSVRIAHLRLIKQRGFSPDDFDLGMEYFEQALREADAPEAIVDEVMKKVRPFKTAIFTPCDKDADEEARWSFEERLKEQQAADKQQQQQRLLQSQSQSQSRSIKSVVAVAGQPSSKALLPAQDPSSNALLQPQGTSAPALELGIGASSAMAGGSGSGSARGLQCPFTSAMAGGSGSGRGPQCPFTGGRMSRPTSASAAPKAAPPDLLTPARPAPAASASDAKVGSVPPSQPQPQSSRPTSAAAVDECDVGVVGGGPAARAPHPKASTSVSSRASSTPKPQTPEAGARPAPSAPQPPTPDAGPRPASSAAATQPSMAGTEISPAAPAAAPAPIVPQLSLSSSAGNPRPPSAAPPSPSPPSLTLAMTAGSRPVSSAAAPQLTGPGSRPQSAAPAAPPAPPTTTTPRPASGAAQQLHQSAKTGSRPASGLPQPPLKKPASRPVSGIPPAPSPAPAQQPWKPVSTSSRSASRSACRAPSPGGGPFAVASDVAGAAGAAAAGTGGGGAAAAAAAAAGATSSSSAAVSIGADELLREEMAAAGLTAQGPCAESAEMSGLRSAGITAAAAGAAATTADGGGGGGGVKPDRPALAALEMAAEMGLAEPDEAGRGGGQEVVRRETGTAGTALGGVELVDAFLNEMMEKEKADEPA